MAVAAATAGKKILLIDTDPQASSVLFAAARDGGRPQFPTVQIAQAILHREAPALAADYDLVLIDAGGRDNATFRSALVAASTVLVPVTPSACDVWASESVFKILEELAAGRPETEAAVVLNQVIPRTVVAREALDALEEHGVPLLQTRLHSRVAWKQAAGEGLAVTEWEPHGLAARELCDLCGELKIATEEEIYREAKAAN